MVTVVLRATASGRSCDRRLSFSEERLTPVNHTTYAAPALNVAIGKTWRRLVPLMFAMYFVAFIDRVNVGFARTRWLSISRCPNPPLRSARDIFAAYALFGIPANLLMNRWGANAGSAPPLRCGGAVGLHRAGDQRTTVYRPAVSAGDRRGRVLPRHPAARVDLFSQ